MKTSAPCGELRATTLLDRRWVRPRLLRSPHPALHRLPLALTLGAALSSCETESPTGNPTRETLPNGAVLVRYPALPAIDSVGPQVTEAHVDLRIGTFDGDDPNYIFGDIRGVQAASDGTMYVLDFQAAEVRVFSPDGEYLRTIVRYGEGPGEILEADGILLSGDTLIWINDRSQMAIIGVDPGGEELRRFDKPVRSYIGIWDGTFDNRGRYWREILHMDDGDEYRPPSGLETFEFRHYYKSYDLSNGMLDSVYTGDVTTRRYIFETEGGGGSQGIPFTPSNLTVVHPSGGFWQANTASYRLTRADESLDTLLVVEAAVRHYPVTADDRSAYVEDLVERRPDLRRVAEAVETLIPDHKPSLGTVFVDDKGRLWVERTTPGDTPPFYDLSPKTENTKAPCGWLSCPYLTGGSGSSTATSTLGSWTSSMSSTS